MPLCPKLILMNQLGSSSQGWLHLFGRKKAKTQTFIVLL
uniref:Uncharacterized protein n=1 Tax=Anguilla anguilla TaxID=7936 RepID=A0A0E9VXB1_ANGAN